MFRFEALRPQQDDRLAFLKGFLRQPKGVGSVIPSSRFLERKMVRMAGVAQAESVIELGPGTGGTTRAILAAMRRPRRCWRSSSTRHSPTTCATSTTEG